MTGTVPATSWNNVDLSDGSYHTPCFPSVKRDLGEKGVTVFAKSKPITVEVLVPVNLPIFVLNGVLIIHSSDISTTIVDGDISLAHTQTGNPFAMDTSPFLITQ